MKNYFFDSAICFFLFVSFSSSACEIEKLEADGTFHVIGLVSELGSVSTAKLSQLGTIHYETTYIGNVSASGDISAYQGYDSYSYVGKVMDAIISTATLNQTSTEIFEYHALGKVSDDGYIYAGNYYGYSMVGRGNCGSVQVGGAALLLGPL